MSDKPLGYFTQEDLINLGITDPRPLPHTRRRTQMSFLNIGQALQGAQEEHAVDAGEYLLRITQAQIKEDKNGRPGLVVRFEIADDPFAKEVSQFMYLPGAGDTPKRENQNLNRLGYFFAAFDIDPAGSYEVDKQEPEGFIGREGWAMLGEPEDDGQGYGLQNRIKKFMKGH